MAAPTPTNPQGPDTFALWAAGLSPRGGSEGGGPVGDGKTRPHHKPDTPRPPLKGETGPGHDKAPGEIARSLARHEHLKFFAEVNEGPRSGRDGKVENPTAAADAIRREGRELDVQGRYEQQQTTYHSASTQKHKYGILLKKQIRKFNVIVRNFRRALVDLRKAQHSKEPNYLAASVGRLVDASSMITEHIHELLQMSHHIKSFDGQIKSANATVKKEELKPDDLSQEVDRQQLSSAIQMKISTRNTEALDSSASMEVGHYETDWAAEACKDGLDLLGEGMGMMDETIQENGEQDRQRRLGQNQEANPRAALYRSHELAYAALSREHGVLRAALKQLTG